VNRPGNTAGDVRLGRPSVVRLLAMVVLIAGTVAAGHLLNAWLDPLAELRGWVNRAGSAGPLLFIVLFLTLNTVGVPLPVLGAASGVAFGPISGATTSLVAMTITACAQFLLARHVVGDRRHAAPAGTFSELNMLAGLTVLKLRDFTIGTIIGCVPKALAWSGLGALLF
jgi:uncharacterized membrane protein YdjX (TVP38/TMEM64 family)